MINYAYLTMSKLCLNLNKYVNISAYIIIKGNVYVQIVYVTNLFNVFHALFA